MGNIKYKNVAFKRAAKLYFLHYLRAIMILYTL